jgi:hypothetical protein
MGRMKWWAIGVAVIGMAATVAVTGLLWMLVTHPVTVAQALARGL